MLQIDNVMSSVHDIIATLSFRQIYFSHRKHTTQAIGFGEEIIIDVVVSLGKQGALRRVF